VRTGQITNGHLCGVLNATDPDKGRTRGTHSLVGVLCAARVISGHSPRRPDPVVINACRHTAVELFVGNQSCKDGHGLPLSNELMRYRTSHRGTQMPVAATRLVRDGEVPFIR
jgi:hypothetical protein